MENEGDLLVHPETIVSNGSERASVDTKGEQVCASSTSEASPGSVRSLGCEQKLATTGRRIDTCLFLLVNFIHAATTTVVAPLLSGSKASSLVSTPRVDLGVAIALHGSGRRVSDGVDTSIGVCPQVFAVLADSGVPFHELLNVYAVIVGDLETACALFDEMEAVTVLDHARLDGEGGCDAIVALCGFNGCSLSVGEEEGGDGRELHFDV